MKFTQHFGLLRILSGVNFTPTVHQPLHSNGCGPFGGKGWTHLTYSYLHTNYKTRVLLAVPAEPLVPRYGTCVGLMNMFSNIYETKIRWREFLIMIFALIACATGRCIQLMRLSLPRAQENAVDWPKWVESLNNDDEVRGQIYISC